VPILKVLLSNPEMHLKVGKDSESCTLWFDAKFQPVRDGSTFTIFYGNQKRDGYSGNGVATIGKRMPNDSQVAEKGFGSLSVYPPDLEEPQESHPHFPVSFEINISLHADTFFHVRNTDPKSHLIYLWLDTESQKDGLCYGDDPNGNEIEWRADKTNCAQVEALSFKIILRPENIESAPFP
jgi:hypothetical protein